MIAQFPSVSGHAQWCSVSIGFWSRSVMLSFHRFLVKLSDAQFPSVSGHAQWCTFPSVSGHRLMKNTNIIRQCYCSNPYRDLGPIKNAALVVRVPLFLRCHGQACYCFPTEFKISGQRKARVDKCIRTAGTSCFGWSKQPPLSQVAATQPRRIMPCRLYIWTQTTQWQLPQYWAVLNVNFQQFMFCCHGFCCLHVWCPVVVVFFHHQDTMSY